MEQKMTDPKSKTILIVEDDSSARRAIGRFLKCEGWKILEAPNGVQGLRVFRSQLPEIVLTDVVMPGLDGFFLTAVIKSISPHSPVIIMTGLGDAELDGKAQDLGAALLRKPFEPEQLLVVLSHLSGNGHKEISVRACTGAI
jgi:DNA-binding response OmpR family regulator